MLLRCNQTNAAHTQMHVWNDHPIISYNLSIHFKCDMSCLLLCCPSHHSLFWDLTHLYVCVFDECVCLWAGVLWYEVTVFLCVAEFRSPSHVSGLNRSASLSCTERVDSESISGSNSQLNNSPAAQYVPDFNVRALADLQYVKVCYACQQQSFSLAFTQVCAWLQKTWNIAQELHGLILCCFLKLDFTSAVLYI